MNKFKQLVESAAQKKTLKEDAMLDQIIELYGWRTTRDGEIADLGRGRVFEIITNAEDEEYELWFVERGNRRMLTSGYLHDRRTIRELKEYMHDFVAGRWSDVDAKFFDALDL